MSNVPSSYALPIDHTPLVDTSSSDGTHPSLVIQCLLRSVDSQHKTLSVVDGTRPHLVDGTRSSPHTASDRPTLQPIVSSDGKDKYPQGDDSHHSLMLSLPSTTTSSASTSPSPQTSPPPSSSPPSPSPPSLASASLIHSITNDILSAKRRRSQQAAATATVATKASTPRVGGKGRAGRKRRGSGQDPAHHPITPPPNKRQCFSSNHNPPTTARNNTQPPRTRQPTIPKTSHALSHPTQKNHGIMTINHPSNKSPREYQLPVLSTQDLDGPLLPTPPTTCVHAGVAGSPSMFCNTDDDTDDLFYDPLYSIINHVHTTLHTNNTTTNNNRANNNHINPGIPSTGGDRHHNSVNTHNNSTTTNHNTTSHKSSSLSSSSSLFYPKHPRIMTLRHINGKALRVACMHTVSYSNYYRKENGKPLLYWDSQLAAIAYIHSRDMGQGRAPFTHHGVKARFSSYPIPYLLAAENLYMDSGADISSLARCAVDGWINSPGHRRNLLRDVRWCGIGIYVNESGVSYVTQLFASYK